MEPISTGLPDAAEWSSRDGVLFKIGASEIRGAFSFDHAGINRIHADFPGTELAGEHAGDGVDGAFCTAIDGGARRP